MRITLRTVACTWAVAGLLAAGMADLEAGSPDQEVKSVPRLIRFSGTLQPQTAKAAGAVVRIADGRG